MTMTSAEALLADLLSRGIELRVIEGRVRWRPANMVAGPLAERVRSHAAELTELLSAPDTLPRCVLCGWTLDSRRRCPKCFDRECAACGRMTGSYLIAHCVGCGNALDN
jgi:hypothetical protein